MYIRKTAGHGTSDVWTWTFYAFCSFELHNWTDGETDEQTDGRQRTDRVQRIARLSLVKDAVRLQALKQVDNKELKEALKAADEKIDEFRQTNNTELQAIRDLIEVGLLASTSSRQDIMNR